MSTQSVRSKSLNVANRRVMIGSLLAASVLAIAPGCSSVPEAKGWKSWWPGKKEPKPEIPVRMSVMWSPDILVGPNHTPTRGLGGRIFFFNDRGKPAIVDGDLSIHGFDEKDPSGARNARRYRFTADQLPGHYSTNDLGGSYSFWLPWDAMGSEQRRLTLVTTFQPKDGSRPIQSEAATVLLPGPTSEAPPVIAPAAKHLPTTGSGSLPPNVEELPAPAQLQQPTVSPVGLQSTLIGNAPGPVRR